MNTPTSLQIIHPLLRQLATILGETYTSVVITGNGSALLTGVLIGAGMFELKFDGNRFGIFGYYVSAEGVASVGAVTTESYPALIGFEGNSNRQLILKNLSNTAKTFYYRKL